MRQYHLTITFKLEDEYLENSVTEEELKIALEEVLKQKTSECKVSAFTEEVKNKSQGWRTDDISEDFLI